MVATKKTLLIASFVLILSASNLSRMNGLTCIKVIHVVTLLTMGGALAIMLQAAIKHFRKK